MCVTSEWKYLRPYAAFSVHPLALATPEPHIIEGAETVSEAEPSASPRWTCSVSKT